MIRRWGARRRRRLARTVLGVTVVVALAVIFLTRGTPSTHLVVKPGPRPHAGPVPDIAPSPRLSAGPTLPGMPPVIGGSLYAADRTGMLSPVVAHFPSLVYVPSDRSNTLSVIDPSTYKVVAAYSVACNPQHVVPSWGLRTLWVLDDACNTVTRLDPATGKLGQSIPVDDPYNMYFTPDGRYAVVVSEARQRLVFRDPHTMALVHSLAVDCPGIDHMDFTASGRYAIASCEFSGRLVKIDVAAQAVVGYLDLGSGNMPQDVKASADGRLFYVADQTAGGLWEVDPRAFKVVGFVRTGLGPHGLYPSRDGRDLYVSNRGLHSGHGSVSVLSFATRKVVADWRLPGHSSPDMGGVSADGKVLWLSGRYDSAVYAISTVDGHLIARVPVGDGPHGLAVYPQPGRYSLGHTGVFR